MLAQPALQGSCERPSGKDNLALRHRIHVAVELHP
jgi:hypothetical protein